MRYRVIDRGVALFAALALGAAGAGCGNSEAREPGAGAGDEYVRVVNVEALRVQPAEFNEVIRVVGAVEARNDVVVSAEEGGTLERFRVEKGAAVRRGQPIAEIDDRVLRAQVAEAEAGAKLAAERFERQRRLWEDEKIGSEMTYLQAKYEAEIAAARLENLRTRLERTVIRAPISGVLDDRYVEAGEQVAPGSRVARVVDLASLKVSGGVPERFAGSVDAGDSARVTLDVFPGQSFAGVVSFAGSVVDKQSRTFPVEVEFRSLGGRVKPQMIATVELPGRRLEGALVLPQDAILRTESGYQVYVAEESQAGLVAAARDVRLGPSYRNRTVILEGLEAGELVIVRGQHQVDPGVRVEIVRTVGAEAAAVAEEVVR